jgi:phosphopantothenoylcysteine decarboxylase/phosphopantothenate--cysteine ligase
MFLKDKKVILGVGGGIAVYKAVFLLRLLIKEGAKVKVVMTNSAKQFVSPLTFEVLSGDSVYSEIFPEIPPNPLMKGGVLQIPVSHVEFAKEADLFVLAPATLNTISKMAVGICDNALLATYFSLEQGKPIFICPAMDKDMYLSTALQANLEVLKSRENIILDSPEGELASGLEGKGRLLEPENILYEVKKYLSKREINQENREDYPLLGKKVFVTSGPTFESIDPVRVLTNRSTGKMGLALALEAYRLGGEVTLITGPVSQDLSELPFNIKKVGTSEEMLKAVQGLNGNFDIGIYSAAVGDFTPVEFSNQKIKKDGEELTVKFKKTTDIAHEIGKSKKPNQILVGFALETENYIENAKRKLEYKNLDLIVVNTEKAISGENNQITIVDKKGNVEINPEKTKTETAKDIFKRVLEI